MILHPLLTGSIPGTFFFKVLLKSSVFRIFSVKNVGMANYHWLPYYTPFEYACQDVKTTFRAYHMILYKMCKLDSHYEFPGFDYQYILRFMDLLEENCDDYQKEQYHSQKGYLRSLLECSRKLENVRAFTCFNLCFSSTLLHISLKINEKLFIILVRDNQSSHLQQQNSIFCFQSALP